MPETRVRFLGLEYPIEKGMAAHSNILAWRISWTEEPGELQFMGSQRFGHDWVTNTFTFKTSLLSRITNRGKCYCVLSILLLNSLKTEFPNLWNVIKVINT